MSVPDPTDREAIVNYDEVREVIVLLSCRSAYKTPPVAESIIVTAGCGHRAFMAPTTVAHLADGHGGVHLVCSRCLNAAMAQMPERRLSDFDLRLMPGTAAEAEANLGVAEADQVMAAARDAGFK